MDHVALLGSILMGALVLGVAARLSSIPKVSGYLVAGLLMGPSGLGIVAEHDAEQLSLIGRLAIALILFDIGGEFHPAALVKHVRQSLVISLCETACTMVLVGYLLHLAGAPPELAVLVACVAIETSPSATILVVKELQARGPLSTTLLGVVAFDVLIAISAMQVSLAALGVTTWIAAARTVGGAVVLGGLIGLVLGCVGTRIERETEFLLFAFSMILLTQSTARYFKVSAMLTTMVCGATSARYRNVRARMFDILKSISGVLYAVLFVTAGARLHMSMLSNIGGLGLAYLVGRSVGKLGGGWIGSVVGGRAVGTRALPLALLSHAGVAIGLTMTLGQHLPELAQTASVVVLAAIVPFEIIGPIGASVALRLAHEAGQRTDVLDLDVIETKAEGVTGGSA